jgi:hypothetical protein
MENTKPEQWNTDQNTNVENKKVMAGSWLFF